jgi:response regulator RpfG family c-di-GMP phosphodiesterase
VPLLEVAVLRELSDNRGRQFDPYLVDSFLKLDFAGPRDRASDQQICQQQT